MKRWIGLMCLFSLYSTGSLAQTNPLRFSVLTYNVQSGYSSSNETVQNNLQLIGEKLAAFDIAGIQGCFTNCNILLEATQHTNKFYFQQRPHWWNRSNSGLVSLANFPLIEVKKIFYRAQADLANEKASKGLLLMRYDVNGHILDVYNTHMQSGPGFKDQTTRSSQADELVRYIGEESPDDHLVILHGDFEMGPDRPTVIAKLKLQEPAGNTTARLKDGVDRVLYRSGSNTVFKPISWKDMSAIFVDATGQALSISAPIAVFFEMNGARN